MVASIGLGAILIILVIAWVFLLFWTFRPPMPGLGRLIAFLFLLGVSAMLGYLFYTEVLNRNPNPAKVAVASALTSDKMINLIDIVPGLYDLDYIHRIDTDWENEGVDEEDLAARREWVALYQYDVKSSDWGPVGPFGGAIYDHDDCRPPAILSYELVPVSYDYLAEQSIFFTKEDDPRSDIQVANIVEYRDPLSMRNGDPQDRPEVIIFGRARGARTDLNIFRKVGVELTCIDRQQWQAAHPGEAFPNPLRYQNIGSFRGSHLVALSGSTVTVFDRAGFERSQLVVRRQYRPENGSYFVPGTQVLLDPVEYSIVFAVEPDKVTEVYYPEKAVLAFYRNLGKDEADLQEAKGYLSDEAQRIYDMQSNPFGLSMAPESVARARENLARVLVWEIQYVPDVNAEQLHQDRRVTVTVVGVNEQGQIDYDHPCRVTWTVIGVPKPGAIPFGCEWRLQDYVSECLAVPAAKEGSP
jgi:hypothetical protein